MLKKEKKENNKITEKIKKPKMQNKRVQIEEDQLSSVTLANYKLIQISSFTITALASPTSSELRIIYNKVSPRKNSIIFLPATQAL